MISHAGHGTVARALASGSPVLAVPHSGDMGENAARIDWAGVGVRLPWRLLTPATVRLAVRRALADRSLAARARELGAWAAVNDGAQRAAALVEQLGERGWSRWRRTNSMSSGAVPWTMSIGSPKRLHSSTTTSSSEISTGRHIAPWSSQRLRSSTVTSAGSVPTVVPVSSSREPRRRPPFPAGSPAPTPRSFPSPEPSLRRRGPVPEPNCCRSSA